MQREARGWRLPRSKMALVFGAAVKCMHTEGRTKRRLPRKPPTGIGQRRRWPIHEIDTSMMEGSNGRCIGTAWPSTKGPYPRLSDSGAGQGSHIQVIFASAPPVPDDDRSDTCNHDDAQRRRARETLLDDGICLCCGTTYTCIASGACSNTIIFQNFQSCTRAATEREHPFLI